jgi:hypothetical protein
MIQNFLFLISFFLIKVLSGQEPVDIKNKLSPLLFKYYNSKAAIQDSIDISIAVKEQVTFFKAYNLKIRIIDIYEPSGTIVCRIVNKDLREFIYDPNIIFADLHRKPKPELTTGAFDLTANKINLAHHQYETLDGSSILASVKEGGLDISDIDFKGRLVDTKVASATTSTHASIMATMMAGGGNTSPFAKGAAWGANITSSDFETLLPDNDSVYKLYNVSVQNHSYGTGIENYYGADALAYDQSVINNPSLVHVFSAGNSGGVTPTTGTYSGVTGFANITGSFKMAKNIITVGAIDSFINRVSYSSRGPAFDGRIKPELMAFGFDGSSGAAALVSGTVAMLQQAYKQKNNQNLPSASLIKSVLINSADDIGNANPDYETGYGNLNAAEAIKTINENRIFEDDVSANQKKYFSVNIPAGIAKAKFTLVWTDTVAQANAAKALVNDLDLVIYSKNTDEEWLPWVLNPAPQPESLLSPAERKKDTLNNVEQITIENPSEGEYGIEISGTSMQTLHQFFSIAFQFEQEEKFQWSYPTASDPLQTDKRIFLRWGSNTKENGSISYSINGGNWQLIEHINDSEQQFVQWITPFVEGTILFKYSNNSFDILSDTVVITKPINLSVGFNCIDSFLLHWNSLNVNDYILYQLGDKYLVSFSSTPDTFSILKKQQHPSLHYAVAPVINNKTGLRSYTIDYSTEAIECYLKSFLVQLDNHRGVLSLQLGTVYNISRINFLKFNGSEFVTIQTLVPSELSIFYTDASLTQGINSYRVQLILNNGQTLYTDLQHIYYLPKNPVVIFPNPVKQNEPVRIIVDDTFVYSIFVYDATGKIILKKFLENDIQEIPPLRLTKGLYFIVVRSEEGMLFTQKLIVQ